VPAPVCRLRSTPRLLPPYSYGAAAFTFTTDIASRTLTPTVRGGAVSSWSITPSLPAGLTFDATDGTISGTPTATSAPASYVVTAQNAGGRATATLTVEVDSGTLLDLGHDAAISVLRMNGPIVLSVDQTGHWNLWDYASAAQVASGDLYCSPICDPRQHAADMAGSTVVLATQNGFEVLSATTGQVLSSITSASVTWWSLASDGSYLAAGGKAGLLAWSPSGNSLVSLAGDYSRAMTFAAPGEIEVADGPAGQNVIQTISVPGRAETTGPAFNGAFNSWFLDGSRFLSTAGNAVLVYSRASAQQAVITLPSIPSTLVGQGNWVWTPAFGNSLEVFAIATSSTPAASFAIPTGSDEYPSGTTVAVLGPTGEASILDLSGTTPANTDYTLPIVADNSGASSYAYAAASATQWMIGNPWGVLIDGASLSGAPRYFDYGAAWSVAGSSGSIAVATASGRIVYFDANTLTQEGTIPYLASKVVLSSDGTVLAAAGDENDAQYNNDWSVRIYSLPGGGLLHTWPYSFSNGVVPKDIELSGTGAVLGQVIDSFSSGSTYTLEAVPATGGAAIFSNTYANVQAVPPALLISPDGTLIATSTTGPAATAGTSILKNGAPATAVSGWPVGWIDDGHLLVNTYTEVQSGGAAYAGYAGCSVLDPTGQSTGPCALSQEVDAFEPVTADTIYSVYRSSIYSVSTGSVVWMSGDPASQSAGAVAGNRAVFASGPRVLAQGY
jgi:hypothetical protein